MSYSRDEVRAITDRVIDMADADAVEVRFSGGERAACRYANSNITANLVEHDRSLEITVYYGQKTATTATHQTDDESIRVALSEVQALARRKPDNPEVMLPVAPPKDYVEVESALPSVVGFDPPNGRGWSSRASTSARRRACSAWATFLACTGPTPWPIRPACSPITGTPRPALSSRVGLQTRRVRVGPGSPVSKTSTRSIRLR